MLKPLDFHWTSGTDIGTVTKTARKKKLSIKWFVCVLYQLSWYRHRRGIIAYKSFGWIAMAKMVGKVNTHAHTHTHTYIHIQCIYTACIICDRECEIKSKM